MSNDFGMCRAPEQDFEVDSILEMFFGRYVDEKGRVRDTVTSAPGWVVDCSESLRSARAARLRKEEERRKMRQEFNERFGK